MSEMVRLTVVDYIDAKREDARRAVQALRNWVQMTLLTHVRSIARGIYRSHQMSAAQDMRGNIDNRRRHVRGVEWKSCGVEYRRRCSAHVYPGKRWAAG